MSQANPCTCTLGRCCAEPHEIFVDALRSRDLRALAPVAAYRVHDPSGTPVKEIAELADGRRVEALFGPAEGSPS